MHKVILEVKFHNFMVKCQHYSQSVHKIENFNNEENIQLDLFSIGKKGLIQIFPVVFWGYKKCWLMTYSVTPIWSGRQFKLLFCETLNWKKLTLHLAQCFEMILEGSLSDFQVKKERFKLLKWEKYLTLSKNGIFNCF